MHPSISEGHADMINGSLGEMSDELLVSAAMIGDRTAFVELCTRHSQKTLRQIYRITKNWEDAEDVLQDSLLKAFLHLNGFEGRSSFSCWLTRIAINSALMVLRTKRNVPISIDDTYEGFHTWENREPRDHTRTPESLYAQRETEELLKRAVRHLPAIYRDVVELRHAREYSTLQIARQLGISVAAVKSRLSRARSAMRLSFPIKTRVSLRT